MRSRTIYLTCFFLTLWTCVALNGLFQTYARVGDARLVLGTGLLLLSSIVVSRYVLGLNFSSAPILYLALLGLFHLGTVVPWALGVYDPSHILWFVPYGLSRAVALITYSIIAYQTGLIVALRGRRSQHGARVSEQNGENSRIFLAGNVAVLAGATMFVLGLIRLDPLGYYRLTYSELWRLRAETDPRFFGTGITVALIGLCLMAAGASRRQVRITYLYTGVWFLILFYLGFRSPALSAAVLVYAVSYKKGIRYSRWALALAGLILLIAIPLTTIIREQPVDVRSMTALRQVNVFDGPAELGESLWPLVEALDVVESGNYRYGATYLIAIKGIVPNLAWRWELPATGGIDELPPNLWITAIASPWSYRNYQGIGFSVIAEPYLNFGIVGVLSFFFFLGLLLVWLERAAICSAYGLAIWALIVGPLFWSARSDSTQFFRPAVWGLLYLGAVSVWSKKLAGIRSLARRVNLRARSKAIRESQA